MKIGNKIKKIRELKNYTQEYMADRLGINQSGYSRIENDTSDITLSQIDKLSEIFNIKVDDLLNFDEKFVFNNSNFNTFFGNYYNEMNEKEKELHQRELELHLKTIKLLEDKISFLEQMNATKGSN